ncbi:MAG TPA: DUF401 family protein, partial [bacterium]|nr:DUF401 family protein [bacterium]
QKAAINYWFRHVWEYWWPLYPGVILASSIFQVPAWKLLLLHIPLTIVMAASGYFFILRPSFRGEPRTPAPTGGRPPGLAAKTLRESACIIIVILAIFIAGPLLSPLGIKGIAAKYIPVFIGLTCGFAYLGFSEKLDLKRILRMTFTKEQLQMVLMAAGIIIFKDMLVNVNAFEGVHEDLTRFHVPVTAIIALVPFVGGMVIGITVGYVGASFPIVISMLTAAQLGADVRFAYLALAIGSGHIGMMLSPVHLCLIVTVDYFKADILKIYKMMLPAAAVSWLAAVALYEIYKIVLK